MTVVQYVKGNEKVIVSGDAAGEVRVWRHDSKVRHSLTLLNELMR